MQDEGIGYLRIQNLPWSTFQLPLEAGSRPQDLHFDILEAEQTVTHKKNTPVAGLIFNRKPDINRLNARTWAMLMWWNLFRSSTESRYDCSLFMPIHYPTT